MYWDNIIVFDRVIFFIRLFDYRYKWEFIGFFLEINF